MARGGHGVAANQLFTWRRLVAQSELTAGAEDDTDRKPAKQRDGRGLRSHHQAGLRLRQSMSRCQDRHAPATNVDYSLQRG